MFFCVAQARSFEETAIDILNISPLYKVGELSHESRKLSLSSENNLPDPQLDGEYLAAPPGEIDRWGAELSWSLDWPGIYPAIKRETDSKVRQSEIALSADRLQLLYDIKILLADYVWQQKRFDLINQLENANDSIIRLGDNQFHSGMLSIIDFNKIKLESITLKSLKSVLADERKSTEAALLQLAGSDINEMIEEMVCEFPSIEIIPIENLESYIDGMPTIAVANSETEIARNSVKVANMSALPSLSLGYKHAFEDGAHFNGATLGISIPIFSSRHKKAASKAALKEAEFKAETTKVTVLEELKMLASRIAILKSQVSEIGSILNETDHEKVLMNAFQKGSLSLIDYLTERNYFTTSHFEYLSLCHSLSLLELEFQRYIGME